MSTRAYYHPRNLEVDLADLPRWLYDEIASLHGYHAKPPAPPVLTCVGNGKPMYVYRHHSGRYFVRHYAGDNPNGHHHAFATMSDAHKRITEYTQRAVVDEGWTAETEYSTGHGTRLDLAVFGDIQVGVEVQRSHLSRTAAKTRTRKSYDAGWPTAWITDRANDPDWADYVPTARLTTRGWDEKMPPRGTAKIVIGEFQRYRDRARRSGWGYKRIPWTVTLDELAARMPIGAIVPVRFGQRVGLAFSGARDVIDSCTYPGASQWRPTTDTPRHKEATQWISSVCHEATPERPPLTAASNYKPVCKTCGRRTLRLIERCATCQRDIDRQHKEEAG